MPTTAYYLLIKDLNSSAAMNSAAISTPQAIAAMSSKIWTSASKMRNKNAIPEISPIRISAASFTPPTRMNRMSSTNRMNAQTWMLSTGNSICHVAHTTITTPPQMHAPQAVQELRPRPRQTHSTSPSKRENKSAATIQIIPPHQISIPPQTIIARHSADFPRAK